MTDMESQLPTLGYNPGPTDGEPVESQSHLLDQPDVFPPLVVAVAGHLAIVIIVHVTRSLGEMVPDAWALPVRIPASLNLTK